MDFRRASSDERRRRVLIDEVAAKDREEDATESKPTRKAAVRLYSEGAVGDRQPRLTDFVPTRWLPLTLLTAFLVLAPAAIVALGHQMHARGYVQNAPALASLDLTQRGNVAEWFTSLLLAGASLLSLTIFSIRRHRTDDYQGQYRLWLIVAAVLMGASLDSATHIREAFGLLVARLTGQVILGKSSGWCLLGYFLLGGAVSIRVGLEIYRSKAAAALLCVTLGLLTALAVATAGISFVEDPLLALVIRTSLVFACTTSLVLTLASYARFIHREAQGLLPAAKRKKPKPAEESKKKSKATDDETGAEKPDVKSSSTSTKAGPLAGKSAALKPATHDDDDEEEEEEDDRGLISGKLSKAERKRLKRLQSQPQPARRAA
jgi:hypothetical protein